MSELQATLEIQVELTKFYNVDLFQRGYYQVRTSLRTPAKTPVKVEVNLPRNSDCPLVFPASVINGSAVSKTFQILYRNEDVAINDVILFKVHMLVDAQRIEECIDSANMELALDLWFTDEEFGPEQQEKLTCISQRVLKLHFTAAKGLHHHVPVLFDYFHLATVCVTVHGTLVALHQPYMNLNKQPKSGWVKGPESTLESVLFGARPASTGPTLDQLMQSALGLWFRDVPARHSITSRYTVNPRLQQAGRVYRAICGVLLSSYESLQTSYEALNSKLPPYQQIKIEHHDCHKKLEIMCEVIQNLNGEEEFLQMATSDVSTLCAENVILWSQYQEMVTLNEKCIQQLAREHHNLRVKRFAEGFFTFEFPKHAMIACYEPSIHGHTDLAALVRGSNYFMGLLPLPVECWDIDGDHTTLPVIFEDVYCEPQAKHVQTTREEMSRTSSDATEGSDRRSLKTASDTSSVHSGDSSSPKQRRSKRKLIKNLKPDIMKRPSSFIVNEPNSAAAAGSVAGINLKKPDCTLVGFRKINQDAPVYELGTLSPDGSMGVMEPCPTKNALYNAASMPTLLAKGHANMVQSGSMPELHAGATYPGNPELLAAMHSVRPVSELRDMVGLGALGADQSRPMASAQHSLPLPNGAESAGRRTSSLDSSPSDSSTDPNHIENGYVSSNSDSKSSPDPGGLSSDQLTGDHEGDVQAGLDYGSLANTLSKALGEDETNPAAIFSQPDDKDDDDFVEGSKPDGLLQEYMSQFDGSDSGRGDSSSFSDAPLSDSTKDRLGSLIASSSLADSGVAMGSQATLNGMTDGMRTSLDGSLSGNEYTIFELLKEEMDRKDGKSGSADATAAPPPSNNTNSLEKRKKEEEGVKSEDVVIMRKKGTSKAGEQETTPAGQVSERPITSQPRPSSIVSSSSTPELSSLAREKEQKLVSPVGDHTINFITAKETCRRQMKYNGHLYSDFPTQASTVPYYLPQDMPSGTDSQGVHLIVCVHGLDGNSADLRLVRTYLEMAMPGGRHDFLMSERNQPDTFADFEVMTDRLVTEVLYHIEMYGLNPARISFVGHSLGNLIIRGALSRPDMAPVLPKLYTLLSLSGPHLGSLYNTSGLVNMGMWFMQKWKKSGSLLQLSLKDHVDPRQSFIYKLSQKPGMEFFKNILLVGSVQDRYVPFHSSRIELCKSALKDTSGMGAVYAEMVSNILQPIAYKSDVNFVRYDVFHALPNTANSLIGRAAHIAVLDSELFIEKFITVSALKYFK